LKGKGDGGEAQAAVGRGGRRWGGTGSGRKSVRNRRRWGSTGSGGKRWDAVGRDWQR